ncbi:MAG: phosphoribosyltransferase family protein [Actinomycetia bacterium]|nr:phosphoribosyltransferase family protein [Actinomycetes bacterium]
MADLEETVTSLYRLTSWPVSCRHDLLASYPAFKLGERESTVYYARRLAPVVEALIAAQPQTTAWALTAPPCHAIPAAANLLCREIFRLLKGGFGSPARLSLIEIAEDVQQLEQHRANVDYSRLSSTERIEARERSASAIVHHQALSGQTVIFVNDINVTGAQQRVMRHYFEAIGVAVIHWIYIIEVADELGRQAPQIEYDLNTWKYGSFDDFAAFLSTAEITFTSKCIARIFSYDMVELSRLFSMLSLRSRLRILELTIQEERYGGDAFSEKIDLLRTFCNRARQP